MEINYNRNKLVFQAECSVLEKNILFSRERPEKYRVLLHTITVSLGLGEKESLELVDYVCLSGVKNYVQQNEKLTLRLWLSKMLVRNCIFRISSSMFSQNQNAGIAFHVGNTCWSLPGISKIPFSFRTVYILFHSIGFTVAEVAQILNLTIIQVKERLAKAMMIIKDQRL